MQINKLFKTDLVKQVSIFLDILIPFLLFYTLNNNSQVVSWLLLGTVGFIRILLVITGK
jgi:hypothetical protein